MISTYFSVLIDCKYARIVDTKERHDYLNLPGTCVSELT